LEKCNWAMGCYFPVEKFTDSKEQYWISAPSYGVTQKLNGATVSIQNFGIHYVKSVDAEDLPVHAIQDGIVAFSGTTSAFGNTVVIEHGYGLKSVYGHLDGLYYNVGQEVKGTDIIGTAKPSAYSIASTELFFAIYVNGEFVNPFNFIDEPKSVNHNPTSDPNEFISNH
ncbi:MAG: M23 family metallopeptidase, partial [Spirochaetales bacterium]|nr:M23 family metallopeptidase [Spirochaetales bacterium]